MGGLTPAELGEQAMRAGFDDLPDLAGKVRADAWKLLERTAVVHERGDRDAEV